MSVIDERLRCTLCGHAGDPSGGAITYLTRGVVQVALHAGTIHARVVSMCAGCTLAATSAWAKRVGMAEKAKKT